MRLLPFDPSSFLGPEIPEARKPEIGPVTKCLKTRAATVSNSEQKPHRAPAGSEFQKTSPFQIANTRERTSRPFPNSEAVSSSSARQFGSFGNANALRCWPISALPANQATMQVPDPVVAEQPRHQSPWNMKRDPAALAADLEPFMPCGNRGVHCQVFNHLLIKCPAETPMSMAMPSDSQNAQAFSRQAACSRSRSPSSISYPLVAQRFHWRSGRSNLFLLRSYFHA